jgi:hypothetical protein
MGMVLIHREDDGNKQYWRIEQSHHAKKRRDRCPSPDLIKDWMKPRKSETPGRSR